jgi:hypothetical protein
MAVTLPTKAHLLVEMPLRQVARREINPFSRLRLMSPTFSNMGGQVDQNSHMTALAGLGRCY